MQGLIGDIEDSLFGIVVVSDSYRISSSSFSQALFVMFKPQEDILKLGFLSAETFEIEFICLIDVSKLDLLTSGKKFKDGSVESCPPLFFKLV